MKNNFVEFEDGNKKITINPKKIKCIIENESNLYCSILIGNTEFVIHQSYENVVHRLENCTNIKIIKITKNKNENYEKIPRI